MPTLLPNSPPPPPPQDSAPPTMQEVQSALAEVGRQAGVLEKAWSRYWAILQLYRVSHIHTPPSVAD